MSLTHCIRFLDIGDWTITMKEEHGKENSREASFTIETVNDVPVGESNDVMEPGNIKGLFVRRKYKGMWQTT